MALDEFLLEILVCPSTKQGVSLASSDLVDQTNEKIEKGGLQYVGGDPVESAVDSLLLRSDGKLAYPVRDDIPEMLVERGIMVEQST